MAVMADKNFGPVIFSFSNAGLYDRYYNLL